MRVLDVCAGISAPSVAWKPLGWQFAAYAEIDPFPRAVLSHHYPDTPLHGDFTTIKGDEYGAIDLLVGGTPCQSFSIAGLRGGLADDRGNLALEYLRLADRARPRWLVWENVPGVLSSNGGRDFGAILGGMAELGYGFAYRILDAQFCGVPQRRRRVFVVGHLGDWRRAAAVLFERHSLSGHPAPRREARERTTSIVARSVAIRGRDGTPQVELGDELANAILTPNGGRAGIGCGAALIEPVSATVSSKWAKGTGGPSGDECQNLIAFSIMPQNSGKDYKAREVDVAQPLMTGGPVGGNQGGDYIVHSAVRRLTPTECERLQGFPDGYTAVPYRGKPTADGPRYKALGNSMAVPVVRWIGERIALVDALHQRKAA